VQKWGGKITVGRDDLGMKEHGAGHQCAHRTDTWSAFTGTQEDAVIARDVAMLYMDCKRDFPFWSRFFEARESHFFRKRFAVLFPEQPSSRRRDDSSR
jgi:hypothetical protein